MVFAKDTILLLSGKEFLEAVPAVIIITPTILLIGLSNISGIQVLVPTGKESLVLRSVVWGAIVDFILNLIMIPKFGSAGAALGTLAAEFVVLIVQCIYLKELLSQIKTTIEWKCLFGSLVPALIVLIGTYFFPIESVFLRLLIAGCLFFLIYGLGLLVTREEILWSIFNRYILNR